MSKFLGAGQLAWSMYIGMKSNKSGNALNLEQSHMEHNVKFIFRGQPQKGGFQCRFNGRCCFGLGPYLVVIYLMTNIPARPLTVPHFLSFLLVCKSSSLAVPERGSLCYVAHPVLHPFSELAILSFSFFLFPQLLMVSICTCSLSLSLSLSLSPNFVLFDTHSIPSPSHRRLQLAFNILAFIFFRLLPLLDMFCKGSMCLHINGRGINRRIGSFTYTSISFLPLTLTLSQPRCDDLDSLALVLFSLISLEN
ncbi:hypothetical protein VNO77_24341 [Canavalia gladiata]|uniref:Uncharacterized protein n=1 Tax=Canavalia gladiata TaxID=3824 RepID=A0AAN9Q9U3_CANGL